MNHRAPHQHPFEDVAVPLGRATRQAGMTMAATVLLLVFLVILPAMAAEGRAEYAEWAVQARRALIAELPRRSLLKWSEELLAAGPTADGPTLCLAISVFQRAGQPERIAQVIPRLKELLDSERADGGTVDWLRRRRHHAEARQWLDAFPQDLSARHSQLVAFFRWFEKKEGVKATRFWLRDKVAHERATRPDIHRWDRNNWSRLYWERLQAVGKLRAHVAGIAERVRRKPSRMDAVLEYLAARRVLPASPPGRPSVGWLADVARLEHALDNWALAQALADEEEYQGAIRLFDKSLACTIGDYDRQNFNKVSGCSRFFRPDEVETFLRRSTRGELAQVCFQTGRLARAQKLVEELTGKKDGTVSDLGPFLLAGEVQAASGQRVVEARIKKAEEEKKDSARYWLNRAGYYIGRKEYGQAEKAYLCAMKLPSDTTYFDAVRDYGWFLANRQRYREAEKVFRTEIARVGLDDPERTSGFWLSQLAGLDGKGDVRFPWNDPLVWRWLEEEKRRTFGQRAQWRMEWAAQQASKTREWPAFEKKARALAVDPCPPSLWYCLGVILHGHGQPQKGLRMMADAYAHWPVNAYPGARQAGESVLDAHLGQDDWRNAEKVLAKLEGQSGFSKLERSLGRIALIATKAKALDDAMRLWRRKANLDLTDQDDLAALADAGLTDRLRGFYADLAKQAPGNGAIAAALERLKEK